MIFFLVLGVSGFGIGVSRRTGHSARIRRLDLDVAAAPHFVGGIFEKST
jgi:hypothetical protein